MAITDETRKRLWARSGNECALCGQELIRADSDGSLGARVGEEAHIVARSPGGPRYEPLEAAVRDGYDNLILLCANDHTEVDTQPSRYTVEVLKACKREHEARMTALRKPKPVTEDSATLAYAVESASVVWDLMHRALAYQVAGPENLSAEDGELVDSALQLFVDWGEIAGDVIIQGFRAVHEAKQSLQHALNNLTQGGFVVLAGERQGRLVPNDNFIGTIAVLQVICRSDLEALTDRNEVADA